MPRRRVLDLLRHAGESRLTLISAPAGFGKTTLLAEWLQELPGDRAVAWLSLDPSDAEPATFWGYVVAALAKATPGSEAFELLAAAPAPTDLRLAAMVNELAVAPGEVWLVLDDYHLVDGREVGEAMTFLVEHLPPRAHVVISTRADPQLPLARWRARGDLVEIRASELRFDPEEATAYLGASTGLHLSPAEVEALEYRTEGWIAALQLAALSLRGRDDVSPFIARFAGDDRYVVDYLVEEVLGHQTDATRDFLLRSAVLDRLTGPLCDAVTGGGDGSAMLGALDRANLFLVALDDRREWYRYHHLFADVLRARLLAERPDLVPLLHGRASRWYEGEGLLQEAVRHALAASDFDRAARLMELEAHSIRRARQDSMMLSWLTALPAETARRSPVLSAFAGYGRLVAGDLDGVEPFLVDAERALAAVPAGEAGPWTDTEELRAVPATIALYRASLAQARGDVAGTMEQARRALKAAPPGDHLSRGGAAGFLGLAAWAVGDVSTALETFRQAVASLHDAGNVVDELGSTVVLADMWLVAGHPSRARRLCEQALRDAEAHGVALSRAAAELHVELSELDVGADDLESGKRHLDAAAALAGRAGPTESDFRHFVAMALLAAAERDPDRAIDRLAEAELRYRPGFFPNLRPIGAMRARVRIGQGDLQHAEEWGRDQGVTAGDAPAFLREYDHLTLVRLLLARQRADAGRSGAQDALALLDRLRAAADRSGRSGSLLEIRMLQALAHDAQGDRPAALAVLAEALMLAPEPDGNLRLFLDEGAPMTTLLHELQHRGLAGDDARRILAHGARSLAVRGARSPGRSPADPLSGRELEVLRLLDSELTGPEIARQLFVSHNTLRSHTKHIFTKLDVTNRRAAVRRARELGLL